MILRKRNYFGIHSTIKSPSTEWIARTDTCIIPIKMLFFLKNKKTPAEV